MDKKMQRIVGICAGLATGIVTLIAGLAFDLIPANPYGGVFWMIFMPLVIYYSADNPTIKNLPAMLVSYACGLAWGFLAGVLTPTLKAAGVIPFALVEYLLSMFLILFVHKGLLGETPFGKLTCVFLGFAESIACATAMFPADGTLQEYLPPMSFNFIDLFIIFVIGCVICLCIDLIAGFLIGKITKRNAPKPEAGLPIS